MWAFIHSLSYTALPVSIDLQQSYYSVEEAGGSLEVCTEVTSGSLAGRSFLFNYTTIEGTALGKLACQLHEILVKEAPRAHRYCALHYIHVLLLLPQLLVITLVPLETL